MMQIEFVGKNFLPPMWRSGNSLVSHQTVDKFSVTPQCDQSSLSREQVQMLRHGLPARVELAGSRELQTVLASHGLSSHAPAIQDAYAFAKQAHGSQQRDDGSPYHHHSARVAMIAIESFGVTDPDAIKAALLHDVLEDTAIQPEELKRRFGDRTLEYVSLLSKPGLRAGETYDQRNERYLARLEQFGSRDLIALKLADRSDNINDTHLMPDKAKIRRYLGDTQSHYMPLAQRHFPIAAEQLAARLSRIGNWLEAA